MGAFRARIYTMKQRCALLSALSLAALLGLAASCLSFGHQAPQGGPSPSPQAADDIYALIQRGDMDGLQGILKSRQLVNSPNPAGDYPLHLAVMRSDVGIAEYLLAMGAEIDAKNGLGKTPLRLAVELGPEAMVGLLAKKGASLYIRDDSGADALEGALRRGKPLLSALLTRDNVRSLDSAGRSVLHRAADAGMVDALRIALSLDPEINRKDGEGKTALDSAFLRPQSLDCARAAELLIQSGGTTFIDEFAWFLRCARDGEYNSRRFDDGNSPLHEAVARNQRGYVQFLLEKRVELNAKNSAGQAALHEAVRRGFSETARILLVAGADPNVRDSFDNSPLLISMPAERRRELLELLLSRGANPDLKDKNGNTALHVSAILGYPREESLLLLRAASQVDSANSDGNTPLMLAVLKGNAEQIRLFLEYKANIFALNGKRESPLLAAFRQGPELTAVLLDTQRVKIRDDSGSTPLMLAVRHQDNPAILKLLIELGAEVNARSNSGDSALHLALQRDRRDLGELLIAAGADIFIANMQGELPVSLAIKNLSGPQEWIFNPQTIRAVDGLGNTALHYAAGLGYSKVIPLIVSKGADIQARNANGETPLHAAVKTDAADSIKTLFALKASALARDALGNSPLHLAIQWNAVKSIGLLSQSKESLSLRNLSGKTALHEACRKENYGFINQLLERGADVDARDASGLTPLMEAVQSSRLELARLLIQKAQADVLARDDSGSTALHYAVSGRGKDLCRLLLDAGADIHAMNARAQSPLLIALASGRDGLALLIDSSTVHSQDQMGRSALHLALSANSGYEAVAWLLERGARSNARDSAGNSPLHLAVNTGQYDIAALLAKFGSDIYARNAQAQSPLLAAIARGGEALKALVGMDNSDAVDYLGNNPLHVAAAVGDAQAAAFFVSMGASKTERNLAGETPYETALKRGNTRAAEILK